MHKAIQFIFSALIALLLLAASPAVTASDKKDEVLRRLDQAAKNFRSTSADFQFDTYITDPIPDQETQKGTVYYERTGKKFSMAAHIREENGKPVPKVYVYSGGVVKLYEQLIDQVTTLTKAGQYESWFMLGFGASGKELEEKWEIKYLGSETLLDGNNKIKTEKLEMVSKPRHSQEPSQSDGLDGHRARHQPQARDHNRQPNNSSPATRWLSDGKRTFPRKRQNPIRPLQNNGQSLPQSTSRAPLR